MQTQSLTDRTLTAATWRFAGRLAMYGARLGVVVVLARLLPPSAFGVVGAASIVVGLTTVLTRSGFSTGIIQQKDLTETHIRVAFTLAALQGACSTLVLWSLAPWIAGFFDMAAIDISGKDDPGSFRNSFQLVDMAQGPVVIAF